MDKNRREHEQFNQDINANKVILRVSQKLFLNLQKKC